MECCEGQSGVWADRKNVGRFEVRSGKPTIWFYIDHERQERLNFVQDVLRKLRQKRGGNGQFTERKGTRRRQEMRRSRWHESSMPDETCTSCV